MLALVLPQLLALLKRYALPLMALVAAGVFVVWFVHHERAIGAAKVKAAVEQATAAEHQRRLTVEQWAQQWAQGAVQHVNQLEQNNAALQAQIGRASHAHDHEPCLGRAAVRRLRALGRPQAGH